MQRMPWSRRALVASTVLAGALSGVLAGAPPAGASAPAPIDGTAVPNPVPLQSIGDPLGRTMAQLLADYPSTFGGISMDGGTFVVGEVGHNPRFEAAVTRGLDSLLVAYHQAGRHTVPVRFVAYRWPLSDLYALQNSIEHQAALQAPGTVAVGLDVAADRVVDFVAGSGTGPAAAATGPAGVEIRPLGAAGLHVAPGTGSAAGARSAAPASASACTQATRFLDCSPWDGGDGISTGGIYCTSGFGVHNTATHAEYLLSAGHCSAGTVGYWYNLTFPGQPYVTDESYIGATVRGSASTSGVDTMLLAPQSGQSSCISWGGLSTAPGNDVRYYITGYDDPFQGATVDVEGAASFERQGTVSYTNVSTTGTNLGENLVDVSLVSPSSVVQAGDSGGPVVFPTIYGPLAGGTVVGSLSYAGGVYAVFQQIDAILYVDSAWAGATFAVNTATSPTSC